MGVTGISKGRCAALALLVLVISVSAVILIDGANDSSAETIWDKNIIYETIGEEKQVMVTGLIDKTVTEVNLPDTITHNGYPYDVTTIKTCAFSSVTDEDYNNLQSIRLPEKLLYIEDEAFYRCGSLNSITVPASVTTIGEYAFAETAIKTATINGSITSLSNNVFDGCTALTSVKIPNLVVTIGQYAFRDCIKLAGIDMPDALTTVGDGAFQNCASLKISTLPLSMETIGQSVFQGCSSIEEITLSKSTVIPNYMFSGCSSLRKVNTDYGITEVGQDAFSGCLCLTEVPSYKTIKTIGAYAFYGCTCIIKLEITSDVKYIGDYAFSGCIGLSYITIPNTLKDMGESIFGSMDFYDRNGVKITDQSNLPGHSFEMKDKKMTMLDGCYYKISYNVDGGSVPMSDSTVNYDSSIVITQYDGVKDGYVFKGWSCEGRNYLVGDVYRMSGHSVEFKAIWDVYVPPPDDSLIKADAIKFVAWAVISATFTVILIAASLYIIYRRRH